MGEHIPVFDVAKVGSDDNSSAASERLLLPDGEPRVRELPTQPLELGEKLPDLDVLAAQDGRAVLERGRRHLAERRAVLGHRVRDHAVGEGVVRAA